MHQIEQLNGTSIDSLTTVQKAVGFGGVGLAAVAVLSAVFNKPGPVKVVAGAAMLSGFASLLHAAIGTLQTRNALRATDLAPAEASNSAVFAGIALGGAALTVSNIALLAAPTRTGKGLAGARRRRRNRR